MEDLYTFIENSANEIVKLEVNRKTYEKLKKQKLKKLLNDDDACVGVIESAMETYIKELEGNPNYEVPNKNRASHSIVTWLMGIGINEKMHIYERDYAFSDAIWTNTAMLHDYGYLRSETSNSELDIKEITVPYNLLKENYTEEFLQKINNIRILKSNLFSYSNKEIYNYFELSKELHINNNNINNEKCDHGIVGGCLLFNQYCKKTKKEIETGLGDSLVLTEIQKISCFNIASHNIFKSSSVEEDELRKKYKLPRLLKDKKKKTVTKYNGLLMLMSLVDTIECSKRYPRVEANKGMGLYQSKILKSIDIGFDEEKKETKKKAIYNKKLLLDFTKLYKYIQTKPNDKFVDYYGETKSIREAMTETLRYHVSKIEEISDWTEFTTEKDINNDYKVTIVYRLEVNKESN